MADVIVEIEQGKLCGRIAKDANGNDYKSFQGIPYAKPPIGKLRFKAPEPPGPWKDEILDAKKERSVCYSVSLLPGEGCVGSEDCLFLNIYTPKLAKESHAKLPVMVWIHGGGFFSGSGNTDMYGPDYLMAKNVVLVTINYRLGYLGFLSLVDASCGVTGNAGLKDQTQALRWIQKNISPFGGDPNNVTIFGESAGSASVSYHLLSPLSKGLFHKAILQSGVALNPWAKQIRHDYEFVQSLGCKSTDDKEILEFLQNQKVEDILNAQTNAFYETQPCAENCEISPNIEPNIPSAFISDTPENILREGRFNDVPIMIGLNEKEGLIMSLHLMTKFTDYTLKKDVLVPRDLQETLNSREKIEKTIQKIKEFYKITNDPKSLTDYWTDVLFTHKSQLFVKEFARKSSQSVYNYLFKISLNDLKFSCKIFGWEPYEGANHLDEIPYLFKVEAIPTIVPNTTVAVASHIMTTLWTNFAKNGNPNPINTDPHINVEWKPFTINDENYLEIDIKSQLKKSLFHDRVQFWNHLYDQ